MRIHDIAGRLKAGDKNYKRITDYIQELENCEKNTPDSREIYFKIYDLLAALYYRNIISTNEFIEINNDIYKTAFSTENPLMSNTER